jgi:pimeloyl-ACP methyl ester carboxylesterase
MRNAGVKLLERIGKPVVIVAHSQGCLGAWAIADAAPELVRGVVALEPTGPQFRNAVFSTRAARKWGLTDIPISYEPEVEDPNDIKRVEVSPPSPASAEHFEAEMARISCILQPSSPPPRKMKNLSKVKVLVVTGEASYHAMYDWGIVAFLRQAGVETEHFDLGKMGIKGNGHMLFMEKNSDEVARVVEGWVRKVCGEDGGVAEGREK